jgi:ubiquinone/menaquinone biosynthesis C-methylase UbiE
MQIFLSTFYRHVHHSGELIMDRFRHWFVTVCIVLIAATAVSAQVYENDAEWLIDVLQLREGSTLADIGAGGGELTLILANHVGPKGQVYSTELGDEALRELRGAVDATSRSNIDVIAGAPDETNLPAACCDALVMRRVYHHIEDPPAMNASLLRSLKPGGRLAVIDFEPRGSESKTPEGRDQGRQHGVTLKTVTEELTRAGFTVVSSENKSGRDIYVVAEKPGEK